jgi:Lipocalin-like domain
MLGGRSARMKLVTKDQDWQGATAKASHSNRNPAVNPTLRDTVLGAWELVSFVARDARTGEDRHPLGTAPRGLILYTADGHMSAQLAESDMSEYIAYGGRFSVNEETSTLHHDVTISMMPELLVQAQFRQASADGDLLTLSATRTDDTGVKTHSRLLWRRPAHA